MRYLIFAFISVVIFINIGFAYAKARDIQDASKQSIIIDTDVGIDDTMAILYLLHYPEIKIKAITVAGASISHSKSGLSMIRTLEIMTNQTSIPIGIGNGQATRLLIQTLKKSQTKINVLALGPLTNIVLALKQNSSIKQKIKRIYIMGGAIQVKGNVQMLVPNTKNDKAEWNIYIDPFAAKEIMSSGIPITLVPLDVTNQTPLTMDFVEKLNKQENKTSKFIYETLMKKRELIREGFYKFWDPLAAYVLTNPQNYIAKKEYLSVEVESESSWGALKHSIDGYPVDVVKTVDAEQFKKHFLSILSKNKNVKK